MKFLGSEWSKSQLVTTFIGFVGVAVATAFSMTSLRTFFYLDTNTHPTYQRPKPTVIDAPEIVKDDCARLVDGLLLFEPTKTMRQGQAYTVFARLTRNSGVNIAEGLDRSEVAIVTERVSCKVAMSVDSEESGAFIIEKVPANRPDEQLLEPDRFSQWDWHVTPKQHGSMHLLLYVTPMLYVDGIGEGLKEFKQPPRVITVTPDYLYEAGQFLKDNWAILSVLLTAVFVPLLLWFRREISESFDKDNAEKRSAGFRAGVNKGS